MSGSTMLKKVLPVLLVLVILIVAGAVVSGALEKEKATPNISDRDSVYVSIEEDGKKFEVTKGEMYDELKNSVGLSSLVTLLNKEILKQEKNAEGINYFDAVKDEDIQAEIDEAIYGEDVNVEDLTEEEKAEKLQDYKDTMFESYGFKSDDVYSEEYVSHYRLVLAKENYAKDQLAKEIAEQDAKAEADKDEKPYFDKDKVNEYYSDNYYKSYWALVIPFATEKEAENALLQIGVVAHDDVWYGFEYVEKVEGSGIYEVKRNEKALTPAEVVEKFVQLYNIYSNKQALVEGVDYTKVDVTANVTALKELALKLTKTVEEKGSIDELVTEIKAKIAEVEAVVSTKGYSTKNLTTAIEAVVSTSGKLAAEADETEKAKLQTQLEKDAKNFNSKVKTYSEYNYVFNQTNEESDLFFDYDKLSAINSTLPNKLNNTYKAFKPFATDKEDASFNEDPNNSSVQAWYTDESLTLTESSKTFVVYVLKIADIAVPELDSVRDEIIAELTEEALTSSYIETKMAALRENYQLTIYDSVLDKDYAQSMNSYKVTHEESEDESSENIAKVVFSTYEKLSVNSKKEFKAAKKANGAVYVKENGVYETVKKYSADTEYFKLVENGTKEISTSEFYTAMEKLYGMTVALSELTYQRFIYNEVLNIYKDMETGKWLDAEKRDEYIENIETSRINFLAGGYASYGYSPATMSWEEFMVALYGVKDEKELAESYLYSDIIADYTQILNNIVRVDEEGEFVNSNYTELLASDAWKLYEAKMEKLVKDYYNVKGIHFLVSKYESVKAAATGGTPVNPEEWADEDKELAKELIANVYAYLNAKPGTYADTLKEIVNAFAAAPYYIEGEAPAIYDEEGNAVAYTLSFAGVTIDVAKYKTAGLFVKYEDLGSFVNGTMVEPFDKAVKAIYDQDMADNVTDRITVLETPIETEYGFHLYINLSSQKVATYESNEIKVNEDGSWEYVYVDEEKTEHATVERVYPQLYEIRLYAKDSQSEELTSGAQTAIASYYTSLAKEVTGTYFTYICQYEDLAELITDASFTSLPSFTKADLDRIIDLNVESWYESNLTILESGDELVIRGKSN